MPQKPTTVQEYISSKPAVTQKRLTELREYLKSVDPSATEELKWGKPAFVNDGILFVYAAAKHHISLHPTPSVIDYFREELSSFISSDNTMRFPLEDPIPGEIVRKVAGRRVYEKREKGVQWK